MRSLHKYAVKKFDTDVPYYTFGSCSVFSNDWGEITMYGTGLLMRIGKVHIELQQIYKLYDLWTVTNINYKSARYVYKRTNITVTMWSGDCASEYRYGKVKQLPITSY